MNQIIYALLSIGFIYIIYEIVVRPKLKMLKAKNHLKERSRHKIDSISNTGFIVYVDSTPKKVKWSDVKSIEFKSSEKIEIVKKDNSMLQINPDCNGKLEFIKKVPEGIGKFNYDYVDQFFAGLKPCKVCGLYSIKENECLNCSFTIDYMKKHLGNDSIEEFLREEQLDYFSVHFDINDSATKTINDARKSDLFDVDQEWVIYPSKSEIQEEKNSNK